MATEPPTNRIWLSSYRILYCILALMLLACLWQAHRRSIFVDEQMRFEAAAPPAGIHHRIDPNTATWQDLSMLPGLGKTVAQQIVAYRQARRQEWLKAHPDCRNEDAPPAFTSPEDLLPVRGIGPRILDNMRPYLQLPDQGPPVSSNGSP